MDRRKKLNIAHILWAINAITLFIFMMIDSESTFATILSLIWAVTLLPAIVFSILGHKKTKDEKSIRREVRKNKRDSRKGTCGRLIFLVFVFSFVAISAMTPAIIGLAIESKSLIYIGVGIEIFLTTAFFAYFIYHYIKKKLTKDIVYIVISGIVMLIQLLFLIYVLGVKEITYILVPILVLAQFILVVFGGGSGDGFSILYLLNVPFAFNTETGLMAAIVFALVLIPAIMVVFDIVEKEASRPKKKIKVTIDENGNKTTKEVEE